MRRRIIFAVVVAFLLPAGAFAHEYWLEPETFFPAPGQRTAVRLYVGDGLTKDREERPFQPARTATFRLFSDSDAWDLKASLVEGALPVYNFSAGRAGTYLLAVERNWSHIKLKPQEFEDYLREDGMEYVIAERRKLGESAKEGRERYARFIKALLQVGGGRDETFKKSAGLRLEITPLENPYSKKVGDELNLQVTFDGTPLAGKAVYAESRDGPTQKMATDREGKVALKLDRGGVWLVRLVFMRRCAAGCEGADWESFWGAFSFSVK